MPNLADKSDTSQDEPLLACIPSGPGDARSQMTDIVNKETRSRMMSGICGRDTRPELLPRRALHARGFRYRLQVKPVSGRPNLVLPKHRVAIIVHG
ncbi:hypothetical protein [Pseudooceanicola spongiae]|uniref:hypothetical protein n=1 Tax=Pseudooceanicola spongiae TaxID=2613965 RepID=UPI00299F8AE9|nr:hypothetical protein [Pseudooceanicola spongiae]